jgi:outer membrane immunogenic protein
MTCLRSDSVLADGDTPKAAHRRGVLRVCAALGLLLAAFSAEQAMAADWPGDAPLRGSFATKGPMRWDGVNFGGQLGYTNLNGNFETSNLAVPLGKSVTSNSSYGGFLGYNFQWDELVVGFDVGFNHASPLETSTTGSVQTSTTTTVATSSLKLSDFGTFRMRGGYAIGQFLPYGFLGAAVGRLSYSTTVNGLVTGSKGDAYAAGFVAGLGMDVALLPNVFLRGEWEFVAFAPVGGIRANTNTGRVGLGVRF